MRFPLEARSSPHPTRARYGVPESSLIVLLIGGSAGSDPIFDLFEKLLVVFLPPAVGAGEFNQAFRHISGYLFDVVTKGKNSMSASKILNNVEGPNWVSPPWPRMNSSVVTCHTAI